MKITIEIDLNEEQYDAVSAYTSEWNGENGKSTISDRITEDAIIPFVISKVSTAYNEAVLRLGQAASSLPYRERKELINQIESQLGK